jgi:transposase
MQRRKRRNHTRESKLEAVRLITEGQRPVAAVARELEVAPERLREWRRQLAADLVPAARSEREENARLRRENARLRMENEFLGKAAAYFAHRPG